MNPDQRRIIRHLAVATERVALNPGTRVMIDGAIAGERKLSLLALLSRLIKRHPWLIDLVGDKDDPVQPVVEEVRAQFKEGKLHSKQP